MSSSSLGRISSDLRAAESFIHEFGAAFATLKSHSSSIVALSDKWDSILGSFNAMRSTLSDQINELEERQKQLDKRQNELELRQKELDSAEKSIDDRCKVLELKEKQNLGNPGAVAVKTEPHGDFGVDSESEDATLRLRVEMDGKTLQLFLNDRFNDHELMGDDVYYTLKLSNDPPRLVLDAMEGFFPPHLKKGDVEYEARVVRSSCVLLLEQLLRLQSLMKKSVKKKARELALKWRENIMLEGESYAVVTGFLMLVAAYRLSAAFDRNDLQRLIGMVDKHVAHELYPRLGISAAFPAQATSSVSEVETLKNRQLQLKSQDVGDAVPTCSLGLKNELDSICKNMDAEGLRSYLMSSAKDQTLSCKVLDAIKFASDPARLVFDVVQGFYRSSSAIFSSDANKASCIFLLEQLMVLSPKISKKLKQEALKFAAHWKARFGKEGNAPLDVFGFLMFLATYKLRHSFAGNDLLALFVTFYNDDEIYRLDQNLRLCRALSLENRIPGGINLLIKEEKLLQAVRFICAFNLVDRFSPTPLLKRLVVRKTNIAVKGCKQMPPANTQDALREITVLKAVIKCISDFKLESQYSPAVLEERICQLEEEISKGKENESKKISVDEKEKKSEAETQLARKRVSRTYTTEPQLPEQAQQKRPKLVAQTTPVPIVAAGSNSTVQSTQQQQQRIVPCSVTPMNNHNAERPNAANTVLPSNTIATAATASKVQLQLAPTPPLQMQYRSPPVITHSSGNPNGVPMVLPPLPYSYMLPSHVSPNNSFVPPNLNPQQHVMGGNYPNMGPSIVPPGPGFNHPRPPPGMPPPSMLPPCHFSRPILTHSYGLQHIYRPTT